MYTAFDCYFHFGNIMNVCSVVQASHGLVCCSDELISETRADCTGCGTLTSAPIRLQKKNQIKMK